MILPRHASSAAFAAKKVRSRMAKGKSAAALFEVINPGQPNGKPAIRSRPRLGLPKWWSNRGAARHETAGESHVPLMPSPPPRVRPSADASSASYWSIDRHQRTLSVRLTYRAAALCGVGAVALLAVVFVVGQRLARTPSPLLSLSSEELRAGPAHSTVLDVNTAAVATMADTASANGAANAHVSVDSTTAATHTVLDTKRSFGLNYVVVQSYLKPEDAQAAKDLLLKHDIFCTVEKNLPHYGSKGWYSVVGLTGFDRIRGVKEYQNYIQSILKISDSYDATHTGFKKFDPQPYKWR